MNIAFQSIWKRRNFFKEEQDNTFGENLFSPFLALKKHALSQNVKIGMVSDFELSDIDLFVFHEVPELNDSTFKYAKEKGKPVVLLNYEPEVVYPESAKISRHIDFVKIFSYNDQLIDHQTYIKLNSFCFDFSNRIINKPFHEKKLCTFISSNKLFIHEKELYSKRLESIIWFEKNRPNDFDFYGQGWGNNHFSCYKGIVNGKRETLSQYKFSICYENARSEYGYITEKIFDCFLAGCIPIYWGAENINEYIPEQCFIDRRDFNSHDELYEYISNMSESDYIKRVTAIDQFIKSDGTKPFETSFFVHTFYSHLITAVNGFHIENHTKNIGWWLYSGKEWFDQQKFDEALNSFETALRLSESQNLKWELEILEWLFRTYSALDQNQASEEIFEAIIAKYPDYPDIHYYKSCDQLEKLNRINNEIKRNVELYKEKAGLNKKKYNTDITIGEWKIPLLEAYCLMEADRMFDAKECLTQAVHHCPHYVPAREEMLKRIAEIEEQEKKQSVNPK